MNVEKLQTNPSRGLMASDTEKKQPDSGPDAPEWVGLSPTPQPTRKALEWALVLEALAIPWKIEESGDDRSRWAVAVPEAHLENARRQLALYEKENSDWPPREAPPPPDIQSSGWSAVWAGGLLTALYFWLGPYRPDSAILERAVCSPMMIEQGQWWRAFSAIGVHGDFVHLMSNLCVIVPVGAAAVMLLGGGVAWSLALASGALANFTYAMLFHAPGVGFGASTAAFGLIGLIGGKRLADGFFHGSRRSADARFPRLSPGLGASKKAFMILGALLAIFAILGTAPHSNIAAHFLGLFYGVLAGGAMQFVTLAKPLPNGVQKVLELAALSLFMYAWRRAAG